MPRCIVQLAPVRQNAVTVDDKWQATAHVPWIPDSQRKCTLGLAGDAAVFSSGPAVIDEHHVNLADRIIAAFQPGAAGRTRSGLLRRSKQKRHAGGNRHYNKQRNNTDTDNL